MESNHPSPPQIGSPPPQSGILWGGVQRPGDSPATSSPQTIDLSQLLQNSGDPPESEPSEPQQDSPIERGNRGVEEDDEDEDDEDDDEDDEDEDFTESDTPPYEDYELETDSETAESDCEDVNITQPHGLIAPAEIAEEEVHENLINGYRIHRRGQLCYLFDYITPGRQWKRGTKYSDKTPWAEYGEPPWPDLTETDEQGVLQPYYPREFTCVISISIPVILS
jgi:hypothetical protein